MCVEPWQTVLLMVILALLFFLVFRLWKQVRCLKFCYIEISDWSVDTLEDIRAHYLEADGETGVYRPLRHYSDGWHGKNDELKRMMKRAGLRPPNLSDLMYPLEG
ncbi:MAG: hypothetical protein ACR2PM_16235 [Hyphomicrobiales bacterium]